MRIVVTGAAGFIGSHLAERLVASGHFVTGIDCFTDYYSSDIKKRNISLLLKQNKFSFLEKNILDIKSIDADYVFHLAAQPGVHASWENFSAYVNNNILATQHMLELVKNSKVKKFIFASSSSVYGDAESMKEDTQLEPISPYGVTKVACEHMCNVYASAYETPAVILRYFTVYGPRQRPDMAFSKFISAIGSGRKMRIYGNPARDFTYIDDIIDATILLMDAPAGSVMNIGSSREVLLNNAIKIIEDKLGKKADIEHSESPPGDMRKTLADISRARKLGYSPKISVKEGLEMQIEWYLQMKQ